MPPRRGGRGGGGGSRRVVTYTLDSPQARRAFEEELDLFDEWEELEGELLAAAGQGGAPAAGGQQQQQQQGGQPQRRAVARRHGPALPSLVLRGPSQQATPDGHLDPRRRAESDEEEALGSGLAASQATDVVHLVELFGSSSGCGGGAGLPPPLIRDVYLGAECVFETALMILSGMAAEQQQQQQQQQQVAGELAAAAALPSGGAEPGVQPRMTEGDAAVDKLAAGSNGSQGDDDWRASWDNLSTDLKHVVLGHVNGRDLARLALTCRNFAAHARQARLSCRCVSVPAALAPAAVEAMVAAHSGATAVSLARWAATPLTDSQLAALLAAVERGGCSPRRAARIGSLSLRGWSWLRDGQVADVVCGGTLCALVELDLSDCSGLTDAALVALGRYQRTASSAIDAAAAAGAAPGGGLDWAATAVAGCTAQPPPAAAAPLNSSSNSRSSCGGATATTSAAHVHRALAGLAAEDANRTVAEGLGSAAAVAAAAAGGGRGLQSVNLAGCLQLSDEGVRGLLAGPVKASLTQLDVSRCGRTTRTSFLLPPGSRLRCLRGIACHAVQELLLQLPPTCPLAEVSMGRASSLWTALVVAGQLTQLSLPACGKLRRLALQCPRLTHLSLAQCTSLERLDPEALRLPVLQHLNVHGCRQLQGESLSATLAMLPQLRSLDANGCPYLTALDLATNTRLEKLDVTGCRRLAALSCPSSCLAELDAVGCVRLAEVELAGASPDCMRRLDLRNCKSLTRLTAPRLLSPGRHGTAAAAAAAAALAAAGGTHQVSPQQQTQAHTVSVAIRVSGCEQLPRDTVAAMAAALKRR